MAAGIITPDFTISSATGTSPGTSPCVLIQFGVVTSVSPDCFFENDINPSGVGLTITQLVFDVAGIDPTTVTCDTKIMGIAGPFADCGVEPLPGGGGTQATFFDGSIPFHSDFRLDFEGFPPATSFGGVAGVVPEPGTLVLFLGGIGALLARRRLRAR